MSSKSPQNIFSAVEYGLVYPEQYKLHHNSASICTLIDYYGIDTNLHRDLWETLEGASHNIKMFTGNDYSEIDINPAKKALKKALTSVGALLELMPQLEMWIENNTLAGAKSSSGNDVREADLVGRGIQTLLLNYLEENSDSRLFHEFRFPLGGEELYSWLDELQERLQNLYDTKYQRKSGGKKLKPLAAYILILLRFWHGRAGKPYSLSRAPSVDQSDGEKTLIQSTRTRFIDFCRDCLKLSGQNPSSANLRTAVESAISDFEGRTDKIPLAKI